MQIHKVHSTWDFIIRYKNIEIVLSENFNEHPTVPRRDRLELIPGVVYQIIVTISIIQTTP